MKKFVALALTVVMVLGLLAGCEKPMDAKTLAQKMDEATKAVTAIDGLIAMDLGMTMSVTGMSMDIGMDLEMDMKTKQDASQGFMGIKMTMEAMGMTEEMSLDTYISAEGDKLVTYAYDSTSETWVKSQEDMTEYKAEQEKLQGITLKFADFPAEKMTLAEEQETVNGKSCYVLTTEMDGTYFQDAMGTIMETMGSELEAETLEVLEGMDWSAMNVKMVYHVDAATFLPLQMTGEITGLGDVLNGLIAELMMGEGSADMGMTIEIPAITFSMSNMKYNEEVQIPEIPQEAIENAIDADSIDEDIDMGDTGYEDTLTNQPQADGTYLMVSEKDSVSVAIPEGYIVYLAEDDMVVASTEDMNNSLSFVLVLETTAEDMKAEYEAMVEMYKEDGYYLSHSDCGEVNGFTVMNLVCNDGTAECYAWKQLGGGVLMVTGSSFDTVPVRDDVLNGIVIGE